MPIILAVVAQLPLKVLLEVFDGTYANLAPPVYHQTARDVIQKLDDRREPQSITYEK